MVATPKELKPRAAKRGGRRKTPPRDFMTTERARHLSGPASGRSGRFKHHIEGGLGCAPHLREPT